MYEAQAERERDPAQKREEEDELGLAPLGAHVTPEGRRDELDKGLEAEQEAHLYRAHGHLFEVDGHEWKERAKGGKEEEVECLGDD